MLNSNQHDSFYSIDNDAQEEAEAKNYHSILPDLATGWRPKNAKIAAPIFIAYEDSLNEYVLQNALGCLPKLIYIGPRHDNSYKFHSLTQHCYNIKYGIKCEEVPTKLKKELEEFTIKSNNRKGIFSGMNPSLADRELQFQSNFESGNLDIVVKASANQYNLFLRPDTNTRGHMQWFYFRVSNQGYPHQKVKFNICNNRKAGVLFCRGMRPFVYSKHAENLRGVKWQQGGENVEYKILSQKQDFCGLYPKIQEIGTDMLSKYFCLSFQYTFESGSDEVHFSYCPPYTYSEMKQHIVQLKKKASSSCVIQQQNLCTSLTGLQIPVLTITSSSNIKPNPTQEQPESEEQRKCILVTGRFHPGESNGSYVLKGFLEYLVSNEAEYLRNKIVFKVIPMINPDGVVFGNYRTSLSGKDLNRKFKAKNIQLFPEIMNLKNFVIKLKKEEKMKIIYFLDFHGHSIKKNVFLYGPEYDIWSTKFERAKILPKTIASKTNMFRYQSCLFRVAAAKKTTARAFMLGLIPYCYTIESSVGLYRSFNEKEKENFCFEPAKWEEMGQIIADSLKQTIMKIDKDVVNVLKKKKKSLQPDDFQSNKENLLKNLKEEKVKQTEDALSEKAGNFAENSADRSQDDLRQDLLQIIKERGRDRSKIKSKQGSRSIKKQKTDEISSQMTISRSSSSKSNREKAINFAKSFNKNKTPFLQNGCSQIKQVEGESDGYSEGKSDCESDDNDLNKQEYKKISGKIMKFIENFNMSVIGERRKNFRMRNKKKAPAQTKNKYYIGVRKTSNPDMAMVPSLKHKIFMKRELSQKRILGSQRQHSASMKAKKLSLYRLEDEKKKV